MGKKVKLFTVETGDEFLYGGKGYVKVGKRNTGESQDLVTGENIVIASMKVVELRDIPTWVDVQEDKGDPHMDSFGYTGEKEEDKEEEKEEEPEPPEASNKWWN